MWGQSSCLVWGAAQRGRFGKHHGESCGTLFVHQTEYQGADDQVSHPRGQSYRQNHPDVHREQGHHEKTAHIHAKHVQESHQAVLKGHWVATSLNPVPKILKRKLELNSTHCQCHHHFMCKIRSQEVTIWSIILQWSFSMYLLDHHS